MTSRGGLGGQPRRKAAAQGERRAGATTGRPENAQTLKEAKEEGLSPRVWPVALYKVGLRTHAKRGSHPALHTGCFKLKIRAPVGCSHDRTLITLGSYSWKGPKTQSVQTGKLKSPKRKGDTQSFPLLPSRWGSSQPSRAGAEKL